MYDIKLDLKGALTGRPYPFTIRVWEHLYKSTVDCSDGFGQSVRAGVAYGKIRRLLPNFITHENDTSWINDRTRFAFEGLPFVNTLLKPKITKENVNNKLIQSIVLLFYFFDHLNNHTVKTNSFIIVFGTSTSLELVSLLLITFYKYSFLKLRISEVLTQKNDLESNFQLNTSAGNLANLLKSDLCLLIGVNTRYEGSSLNLKLRKRYLNSDFNIISLSALLDLTFPVFSIGSIMKILNLVVESNSLLSQTFKNANYPMLIFNSNYFKRFDSKSCVNFIKILTSYTCFASKRWNGLNVLNSSLNDVGTNALNRFLNVKPADLIRHNTIYFLNCPFYIFSTKKFLELKVLNFLNFENNTATTTTKTIIYQNPVTTNSSWIIQELKKNKIIQNYFVFSTKHFYVTSETFLNTEGLVKKSSTVVASNLSLKNDWKLLRRIFKYTQKAILFTKDIKNKKRIFFKSKTSVNYKNYLILHLFPIKVFTRLLFCQLSENKPFINETCRFFLPLNKSFKSKAIFWLQDFYIGNKDLYSKFSKTMIKSSLYVRLNQMSFAIEHSKKRILLV